MPVKQGTSQPNAFRYGPSQSSPGATVISEPGRYCLAEDLRVAGHMRLLTAEGPRLFSDDEFLMRIDASDVVVDFSGHRASSDAQWIAGLTNWDRTPPAPNADLAPEASIKNVTLMGGRIELSRHGMAVQFFGAGPREALVNVVDDLTAAEVARYKDDSIMLGVERERRARLRSSMLPNAAAYPVRNLRIENMRIRAKDYVVVMQGAGSVIRDSVFETDSGTAVWLYGPGAIVENNTFIVHCIARVMSLEGVSRCDAMDAPIRLMHGDGAVIRNNRFVLRGQAFQRALSLFDTGAVVFEGNTFIGLEKADDAVKVFRGTRNLLGTKANVVDDSLLSRTRQWFQ